MPARLLLATLSAAAIVVAAPAAALAKGPAYKPGEVVVRYARAQAARSGAADQPVTRVVKTRAGESVKAAARRLHRQPGVLSATPSYIAHASGWVPPDPGSAGTPGGWQALQWNFMPGFGVDAPEAWQHLLNVGRPGGKGVVVAVLDTGIAYSSHAGFRRSPDFSC